MARVHEKSPTFATLARGSRHTSSRRGLLRGIGSSGLLVLLTTGACRDQPAGPVLEVPLDTLPPGTRAVHLLGDEPVELQRHDDGEIVARSLLCTHFGCRVHWDAAADAYLCPCHAGRFAADGRVLGGPPTEPLRRLPVVVDGERVRVTAPVAGS